MPRHKCWLLVILLAVGVRTATGDHTPPPVKFLTLEGAAIPGERLLTLNAEEMTYSTGKEQTAIPTAKLLTVRFSRGSWTEDEAESAEVRLIQGDVLRGEMREIDESEFSLEWKQSFGQTETLKIPLEQIQSILTSQNVKRSRESLREISETAIAGDRVRLLNGDLLRGDLLAVDSNRIVLQIGDVETEVLWSNIGSLQFNPDLGVAPELSPKRTIVGFKNESTLSLTGIAVDEHGKVSGRTSFGQEITANLTEIESLTFLSERVVPLAQLNLSTVEYTPFLDSVMPLQVDQSVLRTPLKLAGDRYVTGLGMHSKTRVTIPLEGAYSLFVSTIGLDDVAQGAGAVVFRVRTASQTEGESYLRMGSSAPVVIRHDVSEAEQLILEVDFGPQGSLRDYADWGDAFLIKPAPPVADPRRTPLNN